MGDSCGFKYYIAFIFRGPKATEHPTTLVGAYDHGLEADWLKIPYSQSVTQLQKRVYLPPWEPSSHHSPPRWASDYPLGTGPL